MRKRKRKLDSEQETTFIREAQTKEQALGWYIDAVERSNEAIRENPEVFLNPEYLNKVNFVKECMMRFFEVDENDIYVTARQNRKNPFYVIKPSRNCSFYNKTRQQKNEIMLDPIRSLKGFVKECQRNAQWKVKLYFNPQEVLNA